MTENTETTDDQRTAEESVRLAHKLPLPLPCPKCGKTFKSAPALRMHNVRAHGKGWDTSGNFHKGGRKGERWKPNETNEERLVRRRAYQHQLRARYYREGKDSRGVPRPPGWKPGKGRKPRGYRGGNAGMKLPRWSPSRLAKFRRTMREKAEARNRAMLIDSAAGGGKPKRIQIVYPDPKEHFKDLEHGGGYGSNTIPTLKYCPNCGEHLAGWKHQ